MMMMMMMRNLPANKILFGFLADWTSFKLVVFFFSLLLHYSVLPSPTPLSLLTTRQLANHPVMLPVNLTCSEVWGSRKNVNIFFQSENSSAKLNLCNEQIIWILFISDICNHPCMFISHRWCFGSIWPENIIAVPGKEHNRRVYKQARGSYLKYL